MCLKTASMCANKIYLPVSARYSICMFTHTAPSTSFAANISENPGGTTSIIVDK